MKTFKIHLLGILLGFSCIAFGQIQEMELQADDNTGLQLEFRSNNLSEINHMGTLDDGDLIFRSDVDASSETMRINDETGNVGIGNPQPQDKLDVNGNVRLSSGDGQIGFEGYYGVSSGIDYDGLDIIFYNNEIDLGGGWTIISADGGTNADVILEARDDVIINNNGSTSMFINQDGNIGVGTTSPGPKLEVNGGIKIGNSNNAENGTIRFNGVNLQLYNNGNWNNINIGGLPVNCNNFNVTSPAANQGFSQEYTINAGFQVVITVVFDQPVNTSTVVLGSTFNITSGGVNIPGSISWNGSNSVATFTSSGAYGTFCSFTPDCFMSLQLIGTDSGSGAIEDANGCTLDGDNNGVQGGNYSTVLGILG